MTDFGSWFDSTTGVVERTKEKQREKRKGVLSIKRQEDAVDEWETPQDLFEWANEKWGPFDLDAAADDDLHKVDNYISVEQDALTTPWKGDKVWLNPPYGTQWPHFIRRAHQQVTLGNCNRVVCLIPSRTDTIVFHETIFANASEVFFIEKRLRFWRNGVPQQSANFASCIIVFDGRRAGGDPLKTGYGTWT